MIAHLKANGVDLAQTPLTAGPLLAIDAKRERFVDAPQADALLTRAYRRPFVVPGENEI